MKEVLTLIYTGNVQEWDKLCSSKDHDPLALFEIAWEYDLKPMISLATNTCIRFIKADNFKSILHAAHLYTNDKLKKACFEFVQRNAAEVLI